MLSVAIHPINFCTSWRLSGGAIFVIVTTFSRLGSIPRQETIYPSNFPKGMPNIHFSGFSFILNFLMLSNVSTRLEMSPSSSRIFTTMSSTYASVLRPSWLWLWRHFCIPLCRGYVPRVHDRDDSAGPWGWHRFILQQDGDIISPRDRVLLR
jgi:hypothetical protein